MRRLITVLILAALALAAGSSSAAASGRPPISIGVAPSKLQANLVPGQRYTTDLDLYNKGTTPVVVDVYLQDYTISPESAVVFSRPGSLATSAAPWASLSSDLLRVPAHTRREVRLQLDVPQTAAIGTHTLAVVFRSHQTNTDGTVEYRPAVASLMAAGVQNPDGSGLVLRGRAVTRSVDVSWISLHDVWYASDHTGALMDWLFHPTVTANIEVQNTGNTFFNIIKGGTAFTTKFAMGDRGQLVPAPTYTILPDSVRTVKMSWTGAPVLARGSAATRIYYNDTAYLPVQTASYTIIPWHLITVVGVVVALLVLWRVVRRRRRHGRRRSGTVSAPSPWMSQGTGM
jgi:hypothetical protein